MAEPKQISVEDLRAQAPVDPRQQLFQPQVPVDPRQQLFQPQVQEAMLQHEEAVQEPSVPTREESAIQGVREPLLVKIPQIAQPPKPTAKPKAKPKPTQGELLTDQIQTNYTRLVNYLKQAEGTPKQQAQSGSFKGGRFRIYDDVGSPAIGYGHRTSPEETKRYKSGITEEEATRLLMQDIKKAEILATRHFGRKGWAMMDPHRKEMAIDFMYNLGPGSFAKFKSFSRSLRQGDVKGIRARYKRHYSPEPGASKIPLKPRNDLFYKTFILPLETGEIEIGQPRVSKQPIRQALR